MNLSLLGNRLLVRRVEQPTKSSGGVQLPPEYQNSNQMLYCVVKVGSKAPEDLHPGDYVLTHAFQGTDFEFSDGIHKIINAAEVMAIIPKPEPT